MYTFCFDVESLGLYGEGFAVGVSVRENVTGKEVDTFYAGCPLHMCNNYDPSHADVNWLQENILPHLPPPTHETPRQVRDSFWNFYMSWKQKGNGHVTFVADCGSPVESNFLRMCVLDDSESRKWEAPYPLHELGTLLLCCGQNPIECYDRLSDEQPKHNPLCDARQSGRMWIEMFQKLRFV